MIGSEFCDFLSTLLTFRLIKAFDQAQLLEERTYKKTMSVLSRAKKVRSDGETWQLVRLNPSHEEILQELGLIPKPKEPKKRSRTVQKGARASNPPASRNRSRQNADANVVALRETKPTQNQMFLPPVRANALPVGVALTATNYRPYSLTGWESTT